MYEVLRPYPFAGPLHRSSEVITLESRKDSTPGLLQCRAGWGGCRARGEITLAGEVDRCKAPQRGVTEG